MQSPVALHPAFRPFEARSLSLARWLGLAAGLLGAISLTGWTFGLPVLTMVLPGLVTMKANTAICLLFGDVGLFLFAGAAPTTRRRQIAAALAAGMTLIGALSLLEYLTGRSFGIDELLFKDPVLSGAPGRPAPLTSINSVCIGAALLLLRSSRRIILAHLLAAVVVFSSVLAFVGYVYGVAPLYQAGNFTAVALHTSTAFLLLGVGIWCAGSQHGFMQVVTSPETSGLLVRRCAPAALLPFLSAGCACKECALVGLALKSAWSWSRWPTPPPF